MREFITIVNAWLMLDHYILMLDGYIYIYCFFPTYLLAIPIEELIILAFRRIHQFKAFTLTEGRHRLIMQIKGNRINCDLLACRQVDQRDECRHRIVTPSIDDYRYNDSLLEQF